MQLTVDIDIDDILDEYDVSDLLNALKSRRSRGREEWTAKDVAQSIDTLSELTLNNLVYYLSDEMAKTLFEAIKFYHRDLV